MRKTKFQDFPAAIKLTGCNETFIDTSWLEAVQTKLQRRKKEQNVLIIIPEISALAQLSRRAFWWIARLLKSRLVNKAKNFFFSFIFLFLFMLASGRYD